MPPDLLGNIAASSAWMLFCNAPRQIEIVQSTKAPVVPSAPMEAPREPMRKPGLASATTKPSHHVIALRSSRSSTTAVAMQRPSRSDTRSMDKVVQWRRGAFYHQVAPRCKGHNAGTILGTCICGPICLQSCHERDPGGRHGREALGRRALLRAGDGLGPGLAPDGAPARAARSPDRAVREGDAGEREGLRRLADLPQAQPGAAGRARVPRPDGARGVRRTG